MPFSLGFKNKPARPSSNALDYRLVKNIQKRTIPRWSQLKYLSHFLSRSEKIIFNVCIAIAFFCFAALGAFFINDHLERTPKEGGEYSEALIGQPQFINPIFAAANDIDQDLSTLVYSGLFRFNKEQKLLPNIAESYEISSSTKSYDIILRKDIYFADGENLTANDVVFTFDLIQNPEVASPLFSAFQGVKVEKINDFAVRFTLKEPFAPFLSSLTVGILPEHLWSEASPSSIRLSKNNLQPVGAGPWQFNKMVKDTSGKIDSITLSRNPYYNGQRPYFKTLRFKFFDDYSGAIEALKRQNVDALSFLPNIPNFKVGNKNSHFYSVSLPQYTALFFNQAQEAALKSDDVRQALAKSIDKNLIISTALDGHGESIESPILPGILGYNEKGKNIPFNIDEANALLDKNWTKIEPEEYFKLKRDEILKKIQSDSTSSTTSTIESENLEKSLSESIRSQMDPEQTFYRKSKDNKILELTITTLETDEYGRTAASIAKMWGQIGVKTSVQKVTATRLVREMIRNRNYQILLYGEVTGVDPDPFPFWHSSQSEYPGLNLARYSNREVDKLLEDARSTTDNDKRAEFYKKFQEKLVDEIPAVFLYTPLHTMAFNKEIRGIDLKHIGSPADRYDDLPNWYVKTKLKWE